MDSSEVSGQCSGLCVRYFWVLVFGDLNPASFRPSPKLCSKEAQNSIVCAHMGISVHVCVLGWGEEIVNK